MNEPIFNTNSFELEVRRTEAWLRLAEIIADDEGSPDVKKYIIPAFLRIGKGLGFVEEKDK